MGNKSAISYRIGDNGILTSISVNANQPLSERISRKSSTEAKIAPPAKQCPVIQPTVGNANKAQRPKTSSSSLNVPANSSEDCPFNHSKSKPTHHDFGSLLVTMTAEFSETASSSASTSRCADRASGFIAFPVTGLLRVTMKILPFFSNSNTAIFYFIL